MRRGIRCAAAVGLSALLLLTSGCSGSREEKKEGFQPSLDTKAKVQLDVVGFFGNFEALDQVTNDFNQIYPNVTFSYQQVGGDKEEAYLDANPGTDIFMTSNVLVHGTSMTFVQRCIDLKEKEVDLSAIDEQMLADTCVDGKQLAIPMGQNMYGVVANVSLLEKEGLELPQNREEFLNVLSTLKEKGYTPVQGPTSKVYAELTAGLIFSGLCEGQPLQKALKAQDQTAAAEAVRPAMEFVDELISNGYTDPEINASYPDDNYDEAILRFFEGDVPFWVCNTEKVSGMKKRESKSETFQKEPFTYTFLYPPIGDEGAYGYQEPWFGFAANVDGDEADYAVEFLRFLATKDEINTMADIKGIPSVAKENTSPAVYEHVLDAEAVRNSQVNQGEVTPAMVESWYSCITNYAAGGSSEEDAIQEYLDACAGEIR